MRIKPIVPNTGRTLLMSGISMCIAVVVSRTAQPSTNSKMAEGIFVREEVMSKKKAIINKEEKVMSIGATINSLRSKFVWLI
jgi:hypothetical protein